MLTFRSHETLMVCFALVKNTEPRFPPETVERVLYPRYWMSVGHGISIELPIIHTQPHSTVFFPNANYAAGIWRFRPQGTKVAVLTHNFSGQVSHSLRSNPLSTPECTPHHHHLAQKIHVHHTVIV